MRVLSNLSHFWLDVFSCRCTESAVGSWGAKANEVRTQEMWETHREAQASGKMSETCLQEGPIVVVWISEQV